MDKDKTNKLSAGTWDKLTTEDFEQVPKVKFEVNIPVIVEFREEKPVELVGEDGGVYYSFSVVANGTESVIQTSAWTLLRGLKKLGNLQGKKVTIVKRLVKGKQSIEVIPM